MTITRSIFRVADSLRPRLAKIAFRSFVRLRFVVPYQPVPWLGVLEADRAEESQDRWQAIRRELSYFSVPGSAMDLGSQLGYFTFKLAEDGWLCLGIESGASSFKSAQLIQVATEIPNVTFRRMHINRSTIRRLPKVDVVVFMSLWHHLCRAEGLDAAKEILSETMARTRSVMFFETGQSNEDYMGWSKALPRMEPDVCGWIERLLYEAGSAEVRHLGSFGTHLGPKRRHLFAAYTEQR